MFNFNSMKQKSERGSILISVLIISVLLSIICLGLISLSLYHHDKTYDRRHRAEAFYNAENALLEATLKIADLEPDQFLGTYGTGGTKTLTMPYSLARNVKHLSVSIVNDPLGVPDNYQVTATCMVDDKTRTIRALIRRRPPSEVFDYEYFLNNWGWWWGSSITGNGPNRSNWDFDFKDNPTLNGHVFATGEIESNLLPVDPFGGTPPFRGLAATSPLTYVHEGIRRLKMPNLKDLADYEAKAIADGGTIKIGTQTILSGVQGDGAGELSGLYLEGTSTSPIIVNGTVVVRGDLIIKGYMTGMGTIYVGGNLYIASDLRYKNGPSFSPAPSTMSTTDRDAWVDNAINSNKDFIAFAVRESIYGGKVNTDNSDWKSKCFDASTYGLGSYTTVNGRKMYVGDERYLGADGIRTTPDDNINYLDTNNDGTPDSAYNDADEDGVVDTGYVYATHIQMTSTRISKIARYPKDASNNPLNYNAISTQGPVYLDGVFYTNHAMAVRTSGSCVWNGALICRDEAIIFGSSIKFTYDERLHSRYHRKYYSNDPNRIVDLGLPVTESVRILDRYEM